MGEEGSAALAAGEFSLAIYRQYNSGKVRRVATVETDGEHLRLAALSHRL
jgi:hypothetical protein